MFCLSNIDKEIDKLINKGCNVKIAKLSMLYPNIKMNYVDDKFIAYKVLGDSEDIIFPNEVELLTKQILGARFNIHTITLPSSLKCIDSFAFKDCINLNYIKMTIFGSNNVIFKNNIFENCISLESIEIAEGVKSLGSFCFRNCRKLQSISLPSTLEVIGDYCFSNCLNLDAIDIPKSVTCIGDSIFDGCSCYINITCHTEEIYNLLKSSMSVINNIVLV